jgi:hypothetical protein
MKSLSLFAVALALAAAAQAQQFDNPITIPISYYGRGAATGSRASFSFGAELGASSSASSSGYGYFTSPVTMGRVVPGQDYTVTVTGSGTPYVQVWFLPIDGCDFYINGSQAQTLQVGSANFTFKLRVETTNDLAQSLAGSRGGQCSSLTFDKAIWCIGLGSLRNGRFAGAVGFRASSITSSLYNTSSLIYGNVDTSEVSVTRDSGGHITQIQSRDVVLLMDPYNGSGTSYSIRAYQPSNLSTPFITYTVSQYSVSGGAGIRIDKWEDGINWATVLQQVGTVWTMYDWQVVVAGLPFANPITTTTGTVTNGSLVKQKNYVTVGLATELASVVMGGSDVGPKPTTTYSYYSSSAGFGWNGAVQSVIQPSGNWSKYDYFNGSTDGRAGKIWHMYGPWLNAPGDPSGASTSSGLVHTYDYALNYDGTQTAIALDIVTVNGTQTGQTAWAYNWSSATTNSHTIAMIQELDYYSSGNSLTTTTLAYREDDADSFFHGKLHSVTQPDGTKTSYAYFYGTWDPVAYNFAAATSGTRNDRLILAFHGQTGSGTGTTMVSQTQMNSIPWTVDPLYMANNLSTVTETVVDTNGRVVFTAEDIFVSTTDIERISGTARTFNGNNLLAAETDIMRSVPNGPVAVTYNYQAGLLVKKIDIDGLEKDFVYDNYRNTWKITTGPAGSGYFPATTQVFHYYSSGLKQDGLENPRDPTKTTYTYDSAGRMLSSSVPGPTIGSTLTTSYSYPNALQTTVTLPTNATKITYLYLDGRVSEQTGSGQPDTRYSYSVDSNYTYANTQLGTDQSNGWSETKSDWLGRPVTVRTPEVGWTSGSSKVVRKTYNYPAYSGVGGQLASVSTTDEVTSARLLPDHRYVYGNLGMVTQEGDDVDNSGYLEAFSTDRITLYTTSFFKDTGGFNGWMRDDLKQTYSSLPNMSGNVTTTTISETRTRYTRFNNGALLGNYRAISDISTIDSSGRLTADGIWVDPVDRVRMQNHYLQGDGQMAFNYWQDGYLESSSTISGVTKDYEYNPSGQLCVVTEATTNAQVAYGYAASSSLMLCMVQTVPTGLAATTYGYTWNTNQNSSTITATDANGGVANTEYNAMGLPWHT